ncbi:MAG: hypothetical protein K9G30_02555, partial [Parvibaculum sp.]|nr:hypothetical protein [Parvibaculum sp.]
ASGIGTSGKGALSSETEVNTEAGADKGAALDSTGASQTMAQAAAGADGAMDITPGAPDAAATPAVPATPEIDPTSKLTEMGYSGIEPNDAAVEAADQASYTATNADGEKVNVVVDTRTGTIVNENSAETTGSISGSATKE